MNEDTTFNALKYKRYTSTFIVIGDAWIRPGATYWVNDAGQLHREDGPAIECAEGPIFWFLNGEYVR